MRPSRPRTSFPFANLFLCHGAIWFPGVHLCVGALLLLSYTLTNTYNAGITITSPTSRFTTSLPVPKCELFAHVSLKIVLNWCAFGQRSPSVTTVLPLFSSLPVTSCPDLTHSLILLTWPLWNLQTMYGWPEKHTSWIGKPAAWFWKENWTSLWSPESAVDLSLLLTWVCYWPVILSTSLVLSFLIY